MSEHGAAPAHGIATVADGRRLAAPRLIGGRPLGGIAGGEEEDPWARAAVSDRRAAPADVGREARRGGGS